jgi:hypothetical protein
MLAEQSLEVVFALGLEAAAWIALRVLLERRGNEILAGLGVRRDPRGEDDVTAQELFGMASTKPECRPIRRARACGTPATAETESARSPRAGN